MTFSEYQESTKLTAVFPYVKNEKGEDMKDMPLYVCLGLAGESSEVAIKLLADVEHEEQTNEFVDGIAFEIGDCFYYAAQMAVALGVDFEEFFEDRKIFAQEKKKLQNIIPFMVKALGICEVSKKLWRDGNSPVKRKQLYLDMKEYISYLCSFADLIQTDIHSIFQNNIDKLLKRKEKGMLHGDGDKRQDEVK